MIRFSLLVILLTASQYLSAQGLIGLNDKIFVYEALFIENNGDTLTKEKIEFKFNLNPWVIAGQKALVFKYDTDTVGIKNYIYPFEKVRKKHQKNQLKKEQKRSGWENWTWLEEKATTGYSLNDSIFWLHPPRANQYRHNELAGMPQIHLKKLALGESWQAKIIIMMGWYDFKGTLVSSYNVKEKVSYKNNGLSVPEAWHIAVKHSHSKLGESQSSILFDENQYGFLQFDNSFYDGRRIILSLIEVKTMSSED